MRRCIHSKVGIFVPLATPWTSTNERSVVQCLKCESSRLTPLTWNVSADIFLTSREKPLAFRNGVAITQEKQ